VAATRALRTQIAVVFAVLAVIAIALALTGPHLVHTYDTIVRPCASHNDCATVTNQFLRSDRLLQQVGVVLLILPALLGIFWGAPLVARELETGTFRLSLTQSVSRSRWLTTKLVVVGLASVVVAGLLSLMVTWWSSPLDRVNGTTFSPAYIDRRDLVPIGYAAFGFVLGMAARMLIRRTLPAMAAMLVAFIGVRLAIFEWVRPHLMTPLKVTAPIDAARGARGAAHALQICADKLGIREVLTYQPVNRYWPFPIYETAIFIGLALVLAGFCVWRVRRRLT
jgi:hypothetical protein